MGWGSSLKPKPCNAATIKTRSSYLRPAPEEVGDGPQGVMGAYFRVERLSARYCCYYTKLGKLCGSTSTQFYTLILYIFVTKIKVMLARR